MRTLIAGIAAATLTAGLIAAPAVAQNADYSQKLDKFCCYMTLEPGDTTEQYLSFTNTGKKAWYPTGAVPVRLGTSDPNDRTSPFLNPAH